MKNETYLVTGANSGMGFETARLLAARGATVIGTGRSEERLAAASEKLKGVELVRSDAAKPEDIDGLAARFEPKSLNGVFVNAGIATFRPFEEATLDQFDATFALNVRGPFLLLQKLSEAIVDGGSVVINTTIANRKGFPSTSVYAASKGALRSFARVLAAEWAGRGIRVNCVAPGPVDTPIYGKVGMPAEAVAELKAGWGSQVPLGRMGTSEEVARVVVFLLGQEGSFVTGAEIDVDGGVVAA